MKKGIKNKNWLVLPVLLIQNVIKNEKMGVNLRELLVRDSWRSILSS